MAAAEAFESQFRSLNRPMQAQSLVGIGRTGRHKAALPPQKERQAVAVKPNESAKKKSHNIYTIELISLSPKTAERDL
jgi:hypothetical protein